MRNEINNNKITEVLIPEVELTDLSPYARFSLSCIGYRFFDKKNHVIDKWELWWSGFNNINKLLNGEYPITVRKR